MNQQTEFLLKLIEEIPENYRDKSLKALTEFAEFLKLKAEKNLLPFVLCRKYMEDCFSPEENQAWKYLEEENE